MIVAITRSPTIISAVMLDYTIPAMAEESLEVGNRSYGRPNVCTLGHLKLPIADQYDSSNLRQPWGNCVHNQKQSLRARMVPGTIP